MTYNDLMAQLKKLGRARTAKAYRRLGTGNNVFGVSFSDFGKLGEKIKIDHDLALQLCGSANLDARNLATVIADSDELRDAFDLTTLTNDRPTSLTKAAVDAAGRIGKVEEDHGDRSCKTPDAVLSIKEALKRRKPD